MSMIVYGAEYSVYTRIVRMVMAIKRQAYEFKHVDIFDADKVPDDYASQHPFSKIPAFTHDGFRLFETGAICRYVDTQFPDPPLFSGTDQDCARVNQIISIMDSYAYPCLVWGVAVETDEEKVSDALPRARMCLSAIEAVAGHGPGLVGHEITLADIYGIAVFHYFVETPEGIAMLEDFPRLRAWWHTVSLSDWAVATIPPPEDP
jgi:glutathione S-transferase